MVVYSFSQVNLYSQCPKKYQYQYMDKLAKEFTMSPDLILWSTVHEALEWLYNQVKIFSLPSEQALVDRFLTSWNLEIEKAEELRYKGEQTEADYLRRGEHYLRSYYEKFHPFNSAQVVDTEMNMTFNLNSENTNELKFRGIIDRLDKEGDSFIINDYKTNKALPPQDQEHYQEQLTLYAQGIQQKYGKYFKKIKARLYFLHFDLVDEWEIDEAGLNKVLEKYRWLVGAIELARFDYNMQVPDAFPTKKNPFCKYCEYQNICPLWAHLSYGDEAVSGGELQETTIKTMIDEYVRVSNEANYLNKQKESLKDILVAYSQEHQLEQLFGNEASLAIGKGVNYSAKDKSWLEQKLKELGIFEEAIDIPYHKINKLIKEGKVSEQELITYLEKKLSFRLTPKKKGKE